MLKSVKIVGPAGYGIKVTGIILGKTFMRQGLKVFAYTEYPSLIRGGHNTYQVDVDPNSVNSASQFCDILISLDQASIDLEVGNIKPRGIIIANSSIDFNKTKSLDLIKKNKIQVIQIPLLELAKQAGSELTRNTVAIGALMKLINLQLTTLDAVLKDTFKEKPEVIKLNLQAALLGYKQIKKPAYTLKTKKGTTKDMLISGNQASSMGIIASHCHMYVAYPMTPASEILHFLTTKQRHTGMVVHQPEDEIAGIHAALGGSFAGARTATGTSGGGFALMNEGLSLAGMLELPIVIFEVQRPGPATGNPTWTEQGDLSYVLNAGHGEFPRVVIAPGNPQECFQLTQHGFNLADRYQLPVIMLTDKFLGESSYTLPSANLNQTLPIDRGKTIFNNNQLTLLNGKKTLYKRYELSPDGISYRTIPGVCQGEHGVTGVEHREDGVRCEHIANSDEHGPFSFSHEESSVRINMMNKRMGKLDNIQKEIALPKIYGPKKANTTLVAWGSMWGPCHDAIRRIKRNVNLIHFSYLWPLPKNLDKFLKQFKKLILVENNYQGQLGKLIRQETGIQIKNKLLKYDSRPVWPEEIISLLA